jgi:hypothetical protein
MTSSLGSIITLVFVHGNTQEGKGKRTAMAKAQPIPSR